MMIFKNIKSINLNDLLELIKGQIEIVSLRIKVLKEDHSGKKDDDYVYLIKKARRDLEQAKNYFANVSDPDLVDYAVHKILANQSFYSYLLKKAKEKNITSDI